MAIDKPLPDSDDDIIDLTDLVEEGTADDGASGDTGVDMSFEQELDDLFGDAEPMPAKSAPAARADADEMFDLAGFEVADADETAQPAVAAAGDDDVMDLSGLGLDEAEGADEGLTDLGFDDQAAAPAKAAVSAVSAVSDDEAMDISDISFEDLGLEEAAKTGGGADSLDAVDFSDLEEGPAAAAATAPADEAMDLESLDFDVAEPESPDAVAAIAAALTDQDASPAKDVSDADLDALLAEPDEAASDAAMADLLGTLPEVPEDTAGMAALAEAAHAPAPPVAEAAVVAAAAAVPLAAMAVAATARSDAGPSVGGIDLGALDTLIDSSKAPAAEPEATAAPDKALLARLDALEAATTGLAQRLDTLPEAPHEDALAEALAARLELSLAGRLDALRNELPAAGELARADDMTRALEGVRESLTRLEALTQGRQTQFEDFARSMETRIAELRRELPAPDDFVSPTRLTEALDGLRETLANDLADSFDARLEAAADASRQAAGEAIAPLVGRLDALEADRVDPEALAEKLRLSLADDLAASLDDRLATAADTARSDLESLGEALASRLCALENDRIDPEALAAKLRDTLLCDALDPRMLEEAVETAAKADAAAQKALAGLDARLTPGDLDAALKTLRADLTADMERTVPQAAATVIREEIAALLKDFSE